MSSRPYFVTYQGVRRLVEAPGPAAAVQHVVSAAIAELRPARAAEVSRWYSCGYPVDVVGRPLSPGFVIAATPAARALPPVATPAPADTASAHEDLAVGLGVIPNDRIVSAGEVAWPPVGGVFTAVHAMIWASLHAADDASASGIAEIFGRMEQRGALEQHDLVALNLLCPRVVSAIAGRLENEALLVNELADGESIAFQDVVAAIETAFVEGLSQLSMATQPGPETAGAAEAQ